MKLGMAHPMGPLQLVVLTDLVIVVSVVMFVNVNDESACVTIVGESKYYSSRS